MDQFALLLTALVVCLTAGAIVAQLLRWRQANREDRERMGKAVHDDPRWREWSRHHSGDDNRR
jgi:hypothetical protein